MEKTLKEIYKNVCSSKWDLGRDESVKDRAKKIIEFWGENTIINDVNESMIDGLIVELRNRKLSNATINRYLSALSTMITFCLRRHQTYQLERKPYISWLRIDEKGFTSLGCDPRCDFAQADIEQREVGTQEVGPKRINVEMRRLKSLKSSSYQWVLFHLILPYSF